MVLILLPNSSYDCNNSIKITEKKVCVNLSPCSAHPYPQTQAIQDKMANYYIWHVLCIARDNRYQVCANPNPTYNENMESIKFFYLSQGSKCRPLGQQADVLPTEPSWLPLLFYFFNHFVAILRLAFAGILFFILLFFLFTFWFTRPVWDTVSTLTLVRCPHSYAIITSHSLHKALMV